MLPSPSPSVVFQKLEDGAMLFAPETETYFGLNEVGALVWQQLPPAQRTLDELAALIAGRFTDTPIETIRTDVQELLAALVREGLAEAAPPHARDAAPPA